MSDDRRVAAREALYPIFVKAGLDPGYVNIVTRAIDANPAAKAALAAWAAPEADDGLRAALDRITRINDRDFDAAQDIARAALAAPVATGLDDDNA